MIGIRTSRFPVAHADAEVDLVPMIDCIFLLLLFFMLCGRIAMDQRQEQITVPPTRTAKKIAVPQAWGRVVINVSGSAQGGSPPRSAIGIDGVIYRSVGPDACAPYIALRRVLDRVYDQAARFPDPRGTGLYVPMVVIEIRADADCEYRVVQEVEQVIADSVDPGDGMRPRTVTAAPAKRFISVVFTTRKPGDRANGSRDGGSP